MSTHPVTVAVADLLSIPAQDAPAPDSRESAEIRALVGAARVGDQEAFGRLVDLYEHVVLRTALAALGRREDAEDVAQEAFLIAWKRLPGFRGDASFKTWMLTIVWRKALDRRRSRNRWWHRTADTKDDEYAGFRDTVACDPERETLLRDFEHRLALEITRLSPKLRDALLLAASGEHSYADIARILGTRVGTIKWRVSEARRRVSMAVGRTGEQR